MDRNEAKALSRPCVSDRRDTNQSRVELLARDPQHRIPPETIRIKEVGRHLPAAGLVDRSASGPLHLDLVQRDALQRGLPQVLRIDDRVPWQVPHHAVGISEATYLPQIRVLDGRADQEGLLSEGRMNEVDELALKYLQQSRNSLDMHGRNSTVLSSEAGVLRNGFISSFHQDAAIRDASLQAQYGTAVKGEHGITLRMEHDIALRAQQNAALRAQNYASLRGQHDIARSVQHDARIRSQYDAMLHGEHNIALGTRTVDAEGLRTAVFDRFITGDQYDALRY
jgi:hypothetical protein